MLIRIEDKNGLIDTNSLKLIANGADGKLYLYDNVLIKITESDEMTLEKLNDFKKVKEKEFNSEDEFKKSRIIIPEKKVSKQKEKIKKMKVTPLFGYTQRYCLKKDKIESLDSKLLIKELTSLRDETHKILSKNNIAIMDTNPQNIIMSCDNKLHLIDHDRDITDSCMEIEKERAIYKNDYYIHNERKLSQLYGKLFLYKLYNFLDLNNKRIYTEFEKIYNYLDTLDIDKLFEIISNYKDIDEFKDEKEKEILKKKKRR